MVGAFLLAHWARFVTTGVEAYALGLEQYARLGLAVSLLNALLLALDGWYDPDRVRGPLVRVRTLISSVSTALVRGRRRLLLPGRRALLAPVVRLRLGPGLHRADPLAHRSPPGSTSPCGTPSPRPSGC